MTSAVPAPTVVPRRTASSATSASGAPARGASTRRPGDGRRTAADRFESLRDRVHALLPQALRHLVPVTAVGFAAISSFTYAVDLLLLAALFDGAGVAYPVAVTIGYVTAFGLAFLLNRWLNFRSHGSMTRQSGRYVVTAVANYALFILLLSSTLEAIGVQFLVARLLAGACEAVFMYVMMRLFVFAQPRTA